MLPRILFRTHYQADEPRIIIATVTECTSPTESRNDERVAALLVRWTHGLESDLKLSLPGATYAVANARSLQLLNSSNRWSSSGLALSYLLDLDRLSDSRSALELAPTEQRLYLKQYLLTSGALVLALGSWLLKRGAVTDEKLRDESVLEKLTFQCLDDYLTLATDIRDRTAIRRERDRMSRTQYKASTKRHKRYPLIKTLQRLGLLEVRASESGDLTIYPDSQGRLKAILSSIPDVAALERIANANQLWQILGNDFPDNLRDHLPPHSDFGRVVAGAYRYAMVKGLQSCPLDYLDDASFSCFPSETSIPIENKLENLRARAPMDVRFHVNRRGRRAFVLVSGSTLDALDNLLSASRV